MNQMESQSQSALAAGAPDILRYAGGKAAVAEADRHKNILFASLAGVGFIVIVLLLLLALPAFHLAPSIHPVAFGLVVLGALIAGVGLCVINLRAHRRVTVQALLTETLLNSLGQGYLSFDAKGVCGQAYSQACLDLIDGVPAGRNIVDVLRLNEEQKNDFKDWIEMLFAPGHALSFEDIVKFLPQTYAHNSKGRIVALTYRPVRDKNEHLLGIVLIATDQTEEAEAQLRARMQQNFVTMISCIFKERNHFMVTVTHLREFVAKSGASIRHEDSATILRDLHTLKAAVKHFHLDALGSVIHRMEAELRASNINSDIEFHERLKKGCADIDACVRAVLKQIEDLIGQDFEGRADIREITEDAIYDFARAMRDQKAPLELIRHYLLTIAAVPVNEAFRQFEREIKDLAEIMGKRIKPVVYTGSNPRVLLQPMQGFFMSIMHISRNIIDHGIEPAVTRLARGKEPAGSVSIHTDLIDNPLSGRKMLQILISDDGNGIDPALVRARLEKIDPEGSWRFDDDETIIQRITQWEVSTREQITDLSGRGVGMEAVDREVRMLGGTMRVTSELYRNTRFDIRIPYNLDVPEKTPTPKLVKVS